MKKIIKGKVYDTETATYLGGMSNNIPASDFTYYEEELYKKRTGEFFLFGQGGAMTKYAKSCGGGNWSWGTEIIPLTWDAAREWAEKNLSTSKYEEIFGEVTEDESHTVAAISLSTGAYERAKRAAAQAGMSLSAYIESLI